MSELRGYGTIRKRKDGRWEARIYEPQENGGRKRISICDRDRKVVKTKLHEAEIRIRHGEAAQQSSETVADFLDRWIRGLGVSGKIRASTLRSYTMIVRVHLKPGLGKLHVAKLQPRHVDAFLAAKAAETVRGPRSKSARKLSARTVQLILATLRVALRLAMRDGLLQSNPAKTAIGPTVRREEVRPLTGEQFNAFLRAIRGHQDEAVLVLLVALGVRRGEALGLGWEHVALDTGAVQIRRALLDLGGELQLEGLKTKRSRRNLTLPPFALPILKAYKARQSAERLRAGDRWKDWQGAGLVFTNAEGGPLNPRALYDRFQAVLVAAGLPRQRLHDLRHLHASLLLAAGADLREVMERLGHSTITLTADVYTHLAEGSQRTSAARIESAAIQQGADSGGRSPAGGGAAR